MAFRVAARTVLELGAELISSDAVAIYELVKNAIDAGSKDGVTIEFCVTLPHSEYVDALRRIDDAIAEDDGNSSSLKQLKAQITAAILSDAPGPARRAFAKSIADAASVEGLRDALVRAYVEHNWIEFRDTGVGMSRADILENYMVIGTPSRRRDLDARMKRGGESVYLGEKGVGRLSAMRLGARLHVMTASKNDDRFNLLDVDWSEFADLDKMIEDVEIKPTTGERRPRAWTGTTIRINGLNSSWSANHIREIATYELARLSDPFSKKSRRYRMVVLFNAKRVSIPRLENELLNLAHARATGSYEFDAKGKPRLVMDVACGDLGKGNPPDSRHFVLERIDIRSITKDEVQVPASALTTVGPFTFELYWFNRQFLRKQLSPADYRRLGALQKQWSGVMLFRNGYRVFPYGDDTDDWLGLDRKALASGGYKLNKTQFIGRVSITRTGNPQLIDQTSREGLKDCDEKTVFVELLRYVIQYRMRGFLDDVAKRYPTKDVDLDEADRRVEELQTRTRAAITGLLKRHADEAPKLRELLAFFEEMHAYFAAARQRASEVEDERERMVQLAGVGLMLEMIAHELARSTETALGLLTDADPDELPEDVASLFNTLSDEMKTMNRRLRVLDPLSVSGRQRKETFDLVQLVNEILAAHKAQFDRHSVRPTLSVAGNRKSVMVQGVRGMFVQIVENLIQNSIYWMDLKSEDDENYRPKIEIVLAHGDTLMDYSDNGPGIHPSLREDIFTAFFSTKGKSRRQGLGLYIAQDCARSNGLRLRLSDKEGPQKGRLNTFLLERSEDVA